MSNGFWRTIQDSVGCGAPNRGQDVAVVLELMRQRKNEDYYRNKLMALRVPSTQDDEFETKLVDAIRLFQRLVQEQAQPDGIVSPQGNTILFLGGVRNAGKQIIVDMDDQNLYAFEGGSKIFEFYCTTGDEDHPTATKPSLHRIFRKHEKYTSRTYNAPMDYAMFFTMDGKAIHQSNAVAVTSFLKDWGMDSVGSHGCVRLSESNARALFKWAPFQTPVFIDMA